jgi:hypothetical protein
MFLKVGLLETKGGSKEENNISENYWNTSHLCRKKTQRNTLKTVEQYVVWRKQQESVKGRVRLIKVQDICEYGTLNLSKSF